MRVWRGGGRRRRKGSVANTCHCTAPASDTAAGVCTQPSVHRPSLGLALVFPQPFDCRAVKASGTTAGSTAERGFLVNTFLQRRQRRPAAVHTDCPRTSLLQLPPSSAQTPDLSPPPPLSPHVGLSVPSVPILTVHPILAPSQAGYRARHTPGALIPRYRAWGWPLSHRDGPRAPGGSGSRCWVSHILHFAPCPAW